MELGGSTPNGRTSAADCLRATETGFDGLDGLAALTGLAGATAVARAAFTGTAAGRAGTAAGRAATVFAAGFAEALAVFERADDDFESAAPGRFTLADADGFFAAFAAFLGVPDALRAALVLRGVGIVSTSLPVGREATHYATSSSLRTTSVTRRLS